MFVRELDNGDILRVPGYFSTAPQVINSAHSISLDDVAQELATLIDNWSSRGSGFVIERVVRFTICITKFRPLHGSPFIATPKHIANKMCTVNVKKQRQQVFSVVGANVPSPCYS